MSVRLPRPAVRGPAQDVVPLDVLLEQWTTAGIVSADQANLMAASAATVPGQRRRTSLLVEALAYLGGTIALAGCALLTSYFWSDLTDRVRLTMVGSAALVLLLAGAAVPARLGRVGCRLRSVLWLLSTAAWAGAVTVLLVGALSSDGLSDASNAVLVAAATTAYAAALWAAQRYGLQQAALMVSTAGFAASLIVRLELVVDPGVGVWLVGLAWAVLGAIHVFRPPETPIVLGLATAVFGAMTTADSDPGMVLTLVTVVSVVAVAVVRHDVVLLGLGAVAIAVNVPAAVVRWFADSVAVAVALVVVGALLVALSVWITRRSWSRQPRPQH